MTAPYETTFGLTSGSPISWSACIFSSSRSASSAAPFPPDLAMEFNTMLYLTTHREIEKIESRCQGTRNTADHSTYEIVSGLAKRFPSRYMACIRDSSS